MDNAIIIQARTGSTRLPNKMILPFAFGSSILEHLIPRLKTCSLPIIIATSTKRADREIVNIAEKLDVLNFRGSENNVLKRFINTAEHFGVKNIIRICPDNPFIDTSSLMSLITESTIYKMDYLSYILEDVPAIKTHFGFWAEFVTLKTLKRVADSTSKNYYLEHVTNYIYEHPESFNIRWIPIKSSVAQRKDIRLTIDTEVDFTIVGHIYSEIYTKYKNPNIDDVMNFLDTNHHLLETMKAEIKKNSK